MFSIPQNSDRAPRSRRCMGWTLTEMLVAFGVTAILAVIALPVGLQQMERSRQVACAHKLRNLGVAHRVWRSERDDRLAPSTADLAWWPSRHLFEAGAIHLPEEMLCPSMRTVEKGAWSDNSNGTSDYHKVFRQQPLAYGVNTLAFNRTTPKGWGSGITSTYRMFLGKEQNVPLFFDSHAWQANGTVWSDPTLKRARFAFPHDGRSGVLFLDGHVELLDPSGVDELHPLGDRGKSY